MNLDTPSIEAAAGPWGSSLSSSSQVIVDPSNDNALFRSTAFFFLTLPASIAGALFLGRLVWLHKHGREHGLGRTELIYWSSFCLMLSGCISLIATLCMEIWNHQQSLDWDVLLASAAMLLAWILAIVLNREEHKYSIRSSDFILGYYLVANFGMGAFLWLARQAPSNPPPSPTYSLSILHWFLGSLFIGLVVEAWPRGWTKVQKSSTASVFEKANLVSRLSFHYIQPIMSIGYSRPLLLDDLAHLMPERIRSENAYKDLAATWKKQEARFFALVPKTRQEKAKPWLLLRTIALTFGWVGWAPIVLTRVVSTTLIYLQPVLLGRILDFMMASSSSTDAPAPAPQPLSYGIYLAVLMFMVSLVSSITGAQLLQLNAERGMEIRSGLIGLIYRKSLRLSPEARQTQTAGAISNHMSVDVEKWSIALNTLPQWVSAPIELLVALWMLYQQLGWCSLVGLVTVVGLIPVQKKVSAVFSEIKNTKLTTMDHRIRLVTEMLTSIKTVKLYAWENAFKAKIAGYREIEMAVLRRFGVVYAGMTLIFSTTMFMSLLSFGIYATVGGPGGTPGEITPHVIFVSLSLFELLSRPISTMDKLLSSTTSLLVATRRIQAFLLSEELSVDSTSVLSGNSEDDVVVSDAILSWHKQATDDQSERDNDNATGDENTPLLSSSPFTEIVAIYRAPTLTNIDFRLRAGSLTAVVGRIGSGKSSVLSAIIGDMYKYQGSVQVRGSVAYVSQQAWILHCSVKDNILFGKPLDQDRYEAVVRACCLQQDLDMLPNGDQTEIGERGINLSGGQKQRVALARAAYQDADVYLLDDPLSAVDAHVDRHLWKNLIGPEGLLKDKTRLLVTHGLQHLSEVDQVLVMKDGSISEKGHFDELLAAKRGFYQLNLEFSVTANKQRRKAANKATTSSADTMSETGSEATEDTDATTIVAPAISTASSAQDPKPTDGDEPKPAAGLVAAEKMVNGGVGWHMFMVYAKAASYTNIVLVIVFYILVEVAQVGTSFWLRYWSDAAGQDKYSVTAFLVIYAGFTLAYMGFNMVLFYVANVFAAVKGARHMHDRLLDNLVRQPMAFFDVTPAGRIINRFSTDVDAIDDSIIWNLIDIVYCLVAIGGTLVVISISSPQFLYAVPPLILCYIYIQSYFLASSQALKRFMSVSKSPLYQHFSETLAGVSTIRAMSAGPRFVKVNGEKVDLSAETQLAFGMANRWLKIRLEILGSLIVFDAALLAVLNRGTVGGASLVGLSLTYAMNVTGDITYLVRTWAEMSNQLVSVERIEEYAELPQEAPLETGARLPEGWPAEGRVVFRDFSARYREGLEPVLKNVSFEVAPGEKVGIVGRTGAGKSSLTLALFRMIEAKDSYWARLTAASVHGISAVDLSGFITPGGGGGGSIEIDGVDISTLGLHTLRSHLSIIPQDPTLFAGTIRENLDPFHQSTDAELWTALERAHLKPLISSFSEGLSYEVVSNGENFSVGQRSLICLARALLRKTKILVLDEATAAVDVETDELIQRTIRKEFKDRTVLTIAHRIKTVMDSDKILVLERGEVEEYESPEVLLKRREGSLFFRLAEQAGEVH